MDCNAYLDKLIPPSAHDDRVLGIGAESHARNPLGMTLFGNGKLAVAQGVPQLDGTIARARDDLTVVGGEGDGEDIVGVADEAAGRHSSGEFPQSESLIPRGGQSVGTVGGNDLEETQSISTTRLV